MFCRAKQFQLVALWEDQAMTDAKAIANTPAVCQTCSGKHVVGGFVSADSGYQTDPCPDCAGGEREALINQIAEYLDDAPHGGGYSAIAGANCWELLEEAMQALRNSK